jgi:topoisomerase-4 subunit A
MTSSDILRHNTLHTKDLLRQELEIQLGELEDRWHWVSLEKIFFEKGIYKKMERKDSSTWDEQVDDMLAAFGPYRKRFKREITRDDVLKLTEKPVRKISKFDIKKAADEIESIEMTIDEVKNHLAHLTDYAIRYFQDILKKYGKGRERRTEIRNFDDIEATQVAIANEKLYVNYQTGFAGWGLKREEGVEVACECSRMDDIIVFRRDGTFMVTKVQEKGFVGSQECKELLYVSVFRKRDERTVYNLIYRDGTAGYAMVKRFNVTSVTRDRDYPLTKGTRGSKVLYFTANPNGEAEVVTVHHVSNPKLKKVSFDFDFKTLAIKGRQSMGNILTRNAVRSIGLKDLGVSTLSARKIWFDESVKRLNVNEAGRYLGEFKGTDKILAIMQGGTYRTTGFDLANHYDDDLVELRKYRPDQPVTVLYRSAEGHPYLKRFLPEPTDRKTPFLDDDGSTLIALCLNFFPRLEVVYNPESGKKIQSEIIEVEDFIGVKSSKAKGKRITTFDVDAFNWLAPLKEDPEEVDTSDDPEPDLDDPIDDRQGFAEGTQTQLF